MTNLLPSWWRKYFLAVELVIPLVAGFALLMWSHYGNGATLLLCVVHQNRGQIYGTMVSLFGALLGFVITSMSIVLGFSASERFKILKASKYYSQLWNVFTSAIRWLGAVTVLWLCALLLDRESAQKPLLLIICLTVSCISVLRLARCVWVLEKIVQVITSPAAD